MFNLPATILAMSGITGLAMTVILMTVARSFPKDIRGLSEWAHGTLLASMTMLLLLGRGHLPDFLSIVIANVLLLIAFIKTNTASRLLSGAKPWLTEGKQIAVLIPFILLYIWFTYVSVSITARIIVLSAFLLPIVTEQFIFTYRHFESSSGKNIMLISLTLVILGRGLRSISIITNGEDIPFDIFENSIINIFSLAIPALTIPLATVSCIMIASEKLRRSLEHASRHDDLTDTLNKKAVTEVLKHEIKLAKRQKNPLSIMFLDLDNFKKINDLHGHMAGDRVLMHFAKKSKSLLRETDHLSRFGGDEFMAVLPNASTEQTLQIAERINQAGKDSNPAWSVSIGIAAFSQTDTYESILTRADNALYQAKSDGKNTAQINLS